MDLAKAFAPLCAADGCPDLFRPDNHLTPAGHEVAASKLLDALGAPRVPAAPPAGPVAPE